MTRFASVRPLTTLAVAALVALGNAAAAPAATPAASPVAAAETVKRHPLKGVITRVYSERSALMVKHEEIPGVMHAMTMLFKVDAATLQSVKPGQSITGLMYRRGTDWVLEDVKVVSGK